MKLFRPDKNQNFLFHINISGKSGSWRSKFTVEQNDICDAYLSEHMKDLPDLQLKYE